MSKIIIVDWGHYIHAAIFAKLDLPSSYTCCNMLISDLNKVEINKEDMVFIAVDNHDSDCGNWRKVLHPCLDKETEVLTEDGWLFLNEIVDNELKVKIATLNDKKDKVEYHSVNKYYKREYKGRMEHYGGKKCHNDILVTPDHKMFTKKYHEKNFYLIESEKINFEAVHYRKFPYNNKGIEKFILPKYVNVTKREDNNKEVTTTTKYKKKIINIDDWLELLGWYLSEGRVHKRKYTGHLNSEGIVISQSRDHNPVYCDEIEKLLNRLPFAYCVCGRKNINNYHITSRQLANYMQQFGLAFDKHIPKDLLKKLSKKQCEKLLLTLVKGDGSFKTSNSFSYTTSSDRLGDDIQELGLKTGYAVTKTPVKNYKGKNWWRLNFSNSFYPRNNKKIIENFDGEVYDIEIKNHIFFIRRNGKCQWTGNCYKGDRKAKKDADAIDWKKEYKYMGWLRDKLDESTPFHFFDIKTMMNNKEVSLEADDVMAVAVRYYKNKEIVLISQDSDLEMLYAHDNCKIFNPKTKRYKVVNNPYKILNKKIIGKETSDNLKEYVTSEVDYEMRNVIVNLLQLPDEIENAVIEEFDNLCEKGHDINAFPFTSLKGKAQSIYDNTKVITYEMALVFLEKKKKKTKLVKEKKKQLNLNM